MKKEAIIILALFAISFVSATNIINLETYPDHDVWITAKDSSDPDIAKTLKIPEKYFADECGGTNIPYEINDSLFYLTIKVKKGQSSKYMETFGPFVAGAPVNITALPEGETLTLKERCYNLPIVEEIIPEPEVIILNETNETEKYTTEIESNETEEGTGIKRVILSGFSVVEENKPMINTIYYSVIGITALLLIFLTIKQNTKILHSKKKSLLPEEEEDEIDKEIKKTRKKLNELHEKKNRKIHDVKERLIADQKELMKLRANSNKKDNEKDNEKDKD